MRIEFHVTGSDRKALVTAMAEILGVKAKYMGMPSMNYEVDYFTVTKDGTVEFDDRADNEKIEQLLEGLADKGFVAAPTEMAETWLEKRAEELTEEPSVEPQGETVGLTAKGSLIKKALGIPATPIEIGEDRISFPWFEDGLDADEVKAYSHFIAALCEMSKNQKRISATEKTVDNEKYAFRCFLLRLGFIGNEYKTERKILLRNLSGSSAFKGGAKNEISE